MVFETTILGIAAQCFADFEAEGVYHDAIMMCCASCL